MSKARQLADNGAATPNRNMVINGSMNVAQRATSVTGIGANAESYHTVDRIKIGVAGTTAGRLTMTQTADGPVGISANCMKFACTTADTSIAAAELVGISTSLEGQNVQRLSKGVSGAKTSTISFYVRGNAAATYACELFDGDNSRHIVKLFAVTTSWNRIEFSIPADEDDGSSALDDDNAASLTINFWIHGGSNFTGGTLATAWANKVNANRAAGISSFFDATSRTLSITGLQFEVGSAATPFEHKTFGQDLAECQRYFETGRSGATGNHASNNTGFFGCMVDYKAEKRAAATLAQSSKSVREMFQDTILLGSVGSQFALNNVNGFYHDAIHAGSNCKYAFTFTADAEL